MWMTLKSPRKATPLKVAKAVLSAFIGIRKRTAHEHDAVTITPVQVIVAGVIGAAIFVSELSAGFAISSLCGLLSPTGC